MHNNAWCLDAFIYTQDLKKNLMGAMRCVKLMMILRCNYSDLYQRDQQFIYLAFDWLPGNWISKRFVALIVEREHLSVLSITFEKQTNFEMWSLSFGANRKTEIQRNWVGEWEEKREGAKAQQHNVNPLYFQFKTLIM